MEKLYQIGRNKSKNEIYVPVQSVSSFHAQIYIDNNADVFIIDLDSKNGVFINNEKITGQTIFSVDDKIKLGDFTCTGQEIINAVRIYEKSTKKAEKISVDLSKVKLGKPNDFETAKRYDQSDKRNQTRLNFSFIILVAIAFIFVLVYLIFFNIQKQKTDVVYDFGCFSETDGYSLDETVQDFGELTRNTQKSLLSNINLTMKERIEIGETMSREILKDMNVNNESSEYKILLRIMKNIESRLAKPVGYNYKIYFIDDNKVNAITYLGHIFFYRGMFDFCRNESELATIIAHEIAHNELGHFDLDIKKKNLLSKIGLGSDLIERMLFSEQVLTQTFNQRKEFECDLFGFDLIYPTNFNYCSPIDLWERMSQEEEVNSVGTFLRTHPYSIYRVNCLKNHMSNNYNLNCD